MTVVTTSGPGFVDARAAKAYAATTATGQTAETLPRWAIQAGSVPTAGTIFMSRITLLPGVYTTISAFVTVQGVTLTTTFFGLYDSSGNRLAVTADVSTALAAVAANGVYTGTLSYTVTAAADFYLAVLVGSAVTPPQLGRCQAQVGINATAPRVAGRSSATGLTALPDPIGAFNDTAAAPSWWFRYE